MEKETKKEEVKVDKPKRSTKSKVTTILLCVALFCVLSILIFVIFGSDLLPFNNGGEAKPEEKKNVPAEVVTTNISCTKTETTDNVTLTFDVSATLENDVVKKVVYTTTYPDAETAQKECTNVKAGGKGDIECTDTKVIYNDIDSFSEAPGVEKIVGMTKARFLESHQSSGYTCN